MRNELVLRVQLWYNKFEICGGETEEPIPKQVYAFLPMPEDALAGYISSRTRRAGRGAFAPLSGGQRDRRSGDGPAGRFRRNDGIRRRGKTRYPFHAEKYEQVSHRGEREYLRSCVFQKRALLRRYDVQRRFWREGSHRAGRKFKDTKKCVPGQVRIFLYGREKLPILSLRAEAEKPRRAVRPGFILSRSLRSTHLR